jgi:hypothetical protein
LALAISLRVLVAAAEKNDHHLFTSPDVIDAVSGPVVNAQLAYSLANRFDVSSVALSQPLDPDQDPGFGDMVAQSPEPTREFVSFSDCRSCIL